MYASAKKLKTSCKSDVFANKVGKNSRHFVGIFNKTIIPLALFFFFLTVGYNMMIANSALRASIQRSSSDFTFGSEETQGVCCNNLFVV